MTDPILNPITHTTEFLEYIRRPPPFEDALAFLRHKYGATLDETFVRELAEAKAEFDALTKRKPVLKGKPRVRFGK